MVSGAQNICLFNNIAVFFINLICLRLVRNPKIILPVSGPVFSGEPY